MKKLILLLLFIPLVSIGQSYKDLMSISSIDMFKKVVIENGYEFEKSTTDDKITYGFNIERDSTGSKSSKWAYYYPENDYFSFSFSRETALAKLFNQQDDTSKNPYDLIVKDIKEKCKYYKIITIGETDYVSYSCSESSYKGKIGFMVEEGSGVITHFPPQ